MRLKHLIKCNSEGHVSSWRSGSDEHHKALKLAKTMWNSPAANKYVVSTELAPTNVKQTEEQGALYLEERTYFQVPAGWVSTEHLKELRDVGLDIDVKEVEVIEHPWADLLDHKLIKAAFIGWNVSLIAVLLAWGLA
jgi:hypothetical protein